MENGVNKVYSGKIKQEIFNEVSENVKALERLFPSAVRDGQVDFQALKEELGQFEEVEPEKYELSWSGKQNAKRIAQQDIIGKTLKYIPEESKNPETTENLYIEGDNLEVLKLLRQNYYGAIKMIYIDPPYNTGNDFVYNDNFTMDKLESDIAEGNLSELGERYKVNSKSTNRYHANWLNMMYPRLKIAKDLLSDDGVIVISIDDNEVENSKKVCDEIYGESNFRNYILTRRRVKSLNVQFADSGLRSMNVGFEYALVYAKSDSFLMSALRMEKKNLPSKGSWNVFWSNADRPTMRYKLLGFTPLTGQWRWSKEKAEEAIENYKEYLNKYKDKMTLEQYWDKTGKKLKFIRRIENGEGKNGGVQYWVGPSDTTLRTSNWTDIEVSQIKKEFELYFENPKSIELIKTIIRLKYDSDIMVLDFFSGSSTTAHAVMQLNAEDGRNRKFIMVQIPEETDEKSEARKAGYNNICDIGKARISKAGDKIKEENKNKDGIDNLDIGFKVFRVEDTNIRWEYESDNLKTLASQVNSSLTNKQLTLDEIVASGNKVKVEKGMSAKDNLDFMPGFKDIDVVYEILLRQRDIPLSAKVELLSDIGERTYIFAYSYVVCLEEEITKEIVEKLASINPLPIKFILRDSAFGDDIALKDETTRRLAANVDRNYGTKAYNIDYI